MFYGQRRTPDAAVAGRMATLAGRGSDLVDRGILSEDVLALFLHALMLFGLADQPQ